MYRRSLRLLWGICHSYTCRRAEADIRQSSSAWEERSKCDIDNEHQAPRQKVDVQPIVQYFYIFSDRPDALCSGLSNPTAPCILKIIVSAFSSLSSTLTIAEVRPVILLLLLWARKGTMATNQPTKGYPKEASPYWHQPVFASPSSLECVSSATPANGGTPGA